MTSVQQLIEKLQSEQPSIRYEACAQLTALPILDQDAIDALFLATDDVNTTVADAAQRAIKLHATDFLSAKGSLGTPNSFADKGAIKLRLSKIFETFLKMGEKPGIKFNRIGMLLTFLGASIVALFWGLILYGLDTVLQCHIPFLFPLLAGAFIAVPVLDMGKKLGKCRNLPLALSVPLFASIVIRHTLRNTLP